MILFVQQHRVLCQKCKNCPKTVQFLKNTIPCWCRRKEVVVSGLQLSDFGMNPLCGVRRVITSVCVIYVWVGGVASIVPSEMCLSRRKSGINTH